MTNEGGSPISKSTEPTQRAKTNLEGKGSDGNAVDLEASESQTSGMDKDLEPVGNSVERDFGSPTPPSSPPVIERTAIEASSDSAEFPWQPHIIPWRDPLRQRDRLNTDQSRIKTEFLLTAKFIDDVNCMLDYISGWPQQLAMGIMHSFTMDPENQDRKIRFANLGNERWGVRLINPAIGSLGASFELPGSYTRKDLPRICREQGCDEGCPRRPSFAELAADLKKFRKEQMEAKQFKRPLLPKRSDQRASPLPPALPRSNERAVSKKPDDVPSSPRPGNLTLPDILAPPDAGLFPDNDDAQLKYPKSPRPGSMTLPSDMTSPSPTLDDIRDQVERVKASIMMRGGSRVSGQDAVDYLLERAHTQKPIPLEARDSLSPEAFHDKRKHRPLGGKLVHNEKIPAGPNSIRAEELRQTMPLDNWDRTTNPRVGSNAARKKSRAGFFAARVPSESQPDSAPACLKGKQPIATTQAATKIKFRPQW